MTLNYSSDDISFQSLRNEVSGYSWDTFRSDLLAALTVTMPTLPLAMAAALLAGLPLSCGIFATIYSAMLGSLLGSSRHLVLGPGNSIAILIQAGTAEILYNHYRDLIGADRDVMAIQILTQLTFLVGFFQIIAAGCKLGRLTQFVSYSVVVGYIFGTALAMAVTQLFVLMGLESQPGVHSLYERAVYFISQLKHIHIPTAAVGLFSLTLLLILKRIDKRTPAALILLACTGVGVYILQIPIVSSALDNFFSFSAEQSIQNISLVKDAGELTATIPHFELFFFNTGIMNELLPIAFAISLLAVIESVSTGKSIAASSGQILSINQEIFGLGMGNLLSSFIGAMPVSGSASRSSLNYNSGAKTRFSAVMNSVIVAALVISLSFLVVKVPLAAFSAILLITATNMVNGKQFLLCLKATKSDALVLMSTIFSCIFFSLDMAFYIGVILSIILYLKKSAIPQLVEYDFDKSGELINLDISCAHEQKNIRFIKVEGELFFGSADIFQTNLKSFSEDDNKIKVIILQMKNARDIDATSCLALQQLNDYLRNSGRYLLLCGITTPLWDVFCDSGIVESIDRENMFVFDERHPHQYMLKTLARAYELADVATPQSAAAVSEPKATTFDQVAEATK
jgi:sulfate permease, SulP family